MESTKHILHCIFYLQQILCSHCSQQTIFLDAVTICYFSTPCWYTSSEVIPVVRRTPITS